MGKVRLTGASEVARVPSGLPQRRASGRKNMGEDILLQLAATIKARRSESSAKSYTRQLLDAGPEKCAKKFAEESAETVIAAVSQSDAALASEVADTLYHLLVLLECRGVALSDVYGVLEKRMGASGLEEKASRGQS